MKYSRIISPFRKRTCNSQITEVIIINQNPQTLSANDPTLPVCSTPGSKWGQLCGFSSCHAVSPFWNDDVIKWKHFPRYWAFVRGIHRSPVNSPQKGQRRGALKFFLICAWENDWVNNREAGDLSRYRAHYDVTVMISFFSIIKVPVIFNLLLSRLRFQYFTWYRFFNCVERSDMTRDKRKETEPNFGNHWPC